MDDALALMGHDVGEAPLLVLVLLLPVMPSVYALRRGSRLAIVPLVVLAGQVSLWFASYATDRFDNPGAGAGAAFAVLPALGGLLLAVAAAVLTHSPRTPTSATR